MSHEDSAARFPGGFIVDHIGIVVPDIGAAIGFYRRALGCRISEPIVLADHDIEVVFVEMANLRLELIAPQGKIDPARTLLGRFTSADYLKRQPEGGLHHICYLVADLPAALAELGQSGIHPLGSGEPAIGASGRPIIFLDPATTGGSLVELKEAP